LRRRLAVIFALLVLGPLLLVAWLGARLAGDEAKLVRHQFEAFQRDRLRDLAAGVMQTFGAVERQLLKDTEVAVVEAEALRELVRKQPLLVQAFAIGADGKLIHPAPSVDALAARRRTILQARCRKLRRQLARRDRR
jgi:hypothetical protein